MRRVLLLNSFRQQLKPRFAALGIVVVLVLGLLLARLWTMQVLQGSAYASQSEANRVRVVTTAAPRGRILDRNGIPLVTNRATMAVVVTPSTPRNPTELAAWNALLNRLSVVLKMPVADIRAKISSVQLSALAPRTVAIDVPMTAVAYLEEHATDFPGVDVQTQAVRQYPMGSLAAHVLGYTGVASDSELNAAGSTLVPGDISGKAGAEAQFDSVLQGDRGRTELEVDATGREKAVLQDTPPVQGRDVELTIDSSVQKVAEKSLAQAMVDAHKQGYPKARAGAAVAVNIKTGEVLAMASLPTYNPKVFLGGVTKAEWSKLNAKSSQFPLTNRAIQAQYPAASTFKAFVGLGGLEDGIISPITTFVCTGTWTGMGSQWPKHCWKAGGHGPEQIVTALRDSCDIFFYNVGYRFYKAGGEKLQKYVRRWGFDKPTGIDLPGEASGRVPDIAWKKAYNANYPQMQKWLPGDTVNMAIGQGDLLITPMQLCDAYAGIANGGNVMKPHIFKSVLAPDGKPSIKAKPVVEYHTKASASHLALIKQGLVEVTTSGTAKGAFKNFPVTVAGKSGTAQVQGKDTLAVFVGFAPASHPKYCVAVVIEQGGHGGSVAAVATREILAKLLGIQVTHVTATDSSR